MDDARVAAVTGNPRIRNRSTLLGRLQVGEFSSIVGMIKRAQKSFGALFTVSGVITAFRRAAVHEVGYWSADVLTEDIDITWKLQRAGWKVKFEPSALVWILMPETLRGLWKQRLRWARGGAQVLMRNIDVAARPSQSQMWPLLLEICASVFWAYLMLALTLLWVLGLLFPGSGLPRIDSPFVPQGAGLFLAGTCLVQFAFSAWLDSRYDRGLGRYYYWIIWYPLAYWLISVATTIVAYPTIMFRRTGKRARWVSPDRGVRPP
jgi:biofilm PGA synthesis N-glycosyltransferase PgaC